MRHWPLGPASRSSAPSKRCELFLRHGRVPSIGRPVPDPTESRPRLLTRFAGERKSDSASVDCFDQIAKWIAPIVKETRRRIRIGFGRSAICEKEVHKTWRYNIIGRSSRIVERLIRFETSELLPIYESPSPSVCRQPRSVSASAIIFAWPTVTDSGCPRDAFNQIERGRFGKETIPEERREWLQTAGQSYRFLRGAVSVPLVRHVGDRGHPIGLERARASARRGGRL